ncbi:glycosyltransferase family 2 protein [Agrobacterium vitis]|uniref:glycosyltransferase family 2 protein n=1 Tax=Agrobacterium vitis TaxID=373 RepID=UPI0012E7E74E
MTLFSPVAPDGAAGQAAALRAPVSVQNAPLNTGWFDDQPFDQASSEGTEILACLTLFNEPAEAVAATLACLAANQAVLLSRNGPIQRLEVAIVLDGRDRVHPETEALFNRLGFDLDWGCDPEAAGIGQHGADEAQVRVQTRLIPMDLLTGVSGNPLRVHLAVKDRNRGKLDSHAFFFRSLAERLRPDFVLQIDAGSRPAADCLPALLAQMEREPDCAALATNIVMEDAALTDWLQSWQQADFLWQKLSDWPIGNGLGYLEVVPGQASLFRMSAMRRGANGDPLAAYLRGLSRPKSLMEANLFLAEDRIIGAEIVKSHPACTICYHHDANLVTDGCATVGELLRQRRRWTNSTLVARLVAIGSLADLLWHGRLPPARWCSMALALAWTLLQLLEQWFIPASLALLVSLTSGVWQDEAGQSLAWGMAAGVLLFWLYCLASMKAREGERSLSRRLHGCLHGLGLGILLACTVLGFAICLVEVGPVIQGVILMVALILGMAVLHHSSRRMSDLLRLFVIYIPSAPVASFYLLSYALANFHDVSWGTKGLVNDSRTAIPAGWRQMRLRLLTLWVVSNTGLVWLVVGIVPGGAISVLQYACLPVVGQIALASLLLISACYRKPNLPFTKIRDRADSVPHLHR